MNPEELVQLPVPAATLAQVLSRHEDYRVVRRIRRMVRGEAGFHRKDELCVCVLDCETTGMDYRSDRIIELAVQRVYVSADGSIAMTGKPRSWLEDPGVPIPAEISRITGLTDADVKGRVISQVKPAGSSRLQMRW